MLRHMAAVGGVVVGVIRVWHIVERGAVAGVTRILMPVLARRGSAAHDHVFDIAVAADLLLPVLARVALVEVLVVWYWGWTAGIDVGVGGGHVALIPIHTRRHATLSRARVRVREVRRVRELIRTRRSLRCKHLPLTRAM